MREKKEKETKNRRKSEGLMGGKGESNTADGERKAGFLKYNYDKHLYSPMPP